MGQCELMYSWLNSAFLNFAISFKFKRIDAEKKALKHALLKSGLLKKLLTAYCFAIKTNSN